MSILQALFAILLIRYGPFVFKSSDQYNGQSCFLSADLVVAFSCESFPGRIIPVYLMNRGQFFSLFPLTLPIIVIELVVIAMIAAILHGAFGFGTANDGEKNGE